MSAKYNLITHLACFLRMLRPRYRFKVYKGTDVKGKVNNSPKVMVARKQAKAW